jgi:hypothetical protein
MPSLLAPLSIPLRLLDDVRSIAESLTALPRLIDELVVLSRRIEGMQEDLRGLREDLGPLPPGRKSRSRRLGLALACEGAAGHPAAVAGESSSHAR